MLLFILMPAPNETRQEEITFSPRLVGGTIGAMVGFAGGVLGWATAESAESSQTIQANTSAPTLNSYEGGAIIMGPTLILTVLGAALAPRIRYLMWRKELAKTFTEYENGTPLDISNIDNYEQP
jgi:hypothetical protein